MRKLLSLFGQVLRPWLCVVVYLWALEFQSVFSIVDHEPLMDRLADCSAILWNLIFWTTLLCAPLWLLALSFPNLAVTRFSTSACKGGLILVTGYYFALWLKMWSHLMGGDDLSPWILSAAIVVFAVVILRRRMRKQIASPTAVPTLQECFSFGIIPILLGSSIVLVIQITAQLTAQGLSLPSASHAVSLRENALRSRPNIILIVADGLRAQSMSLYGHEGQTTPFLEKLAKTSNVYLNAHSNSTTTQPNVTTLLSGKPPLMHGRLTRELPPYTDQENLLRILRDNGYFTAAIVSNVGASLKLLGFGPFLSQPEDKRFNALTLSFFSQLGVQPTSMGGRMYDDFTEIFPFMGFPQRTSGHGYVDDTLGYARKVVSKLREPFFLFIHVHEPHDPYYSPSPVENFAVSESELALLRKFPPAIYSYYPRSLQAVADIYRKRYEDSIRFVDSELAKFIHFLDGISWSDHLLLIFTADHGESFERGYMNHGEELYENSTQVPLIVKFPAQQHGAKWPGLVQSSDVAPTILHTANIAVPAWMVGLPLEPDRPPMERESIALNFKHPLGRGHPHYPLPTQLAILWKHYKLIVGCDGVRTELYDLHEDQNETINLALRERALVKDLKGRLKSRLERQPREPKLSCSLDE